MLKVISGGQTGADEGALAGAVAAGFSTGGTAPKYYKTENGPNLNLATYGLVESDFGNYKERTWLNVENSDLTIWIGTQDSAGFFCTKNATMYHKKPLLGVSKNWEYSEVEELVTMIKDLRVSVVNFAGNRESKNPGIFLSTKNLVILLGKKLNVKD